MLPLLLLTLAAAPARAQQTPAGFRDEFLGQFDMSMRKFIALAEAMPEERFAWSPGEGVMPVARVYAHVARYNFYYPATAWVSPRPAGWTRTAWRNGRPRRTWSRCCASRASTCASRCRG